MSGWQQGVTLLCCRQVIGDTMGWLAGIIIVAFVVLIILWKTEQQRRREAEAKLAALQQLVEQVRKGLG